MSVLDKRVNQAFGSYERPKTKEEASFEAVYQVKNGELKQTEHSKLDEKIFWQQQREEETLEESSLSDDEKILAAFK